MFKNLPTGFFLISILAACATGVSSASKAPDCPVVGQVDGMADYPVMFPFLGPVVAEQRAKDKAMHKAEKMGATHVIWDSTETRAFAAWVYGTAYDCTSKGKGGEAKSVSSKDKAGVEQDTPKH